MAHLCVNLSLLGQGINTILSLIILLLLLLLLLLYLYYYVYCCEGEQLVAKCCL